MWSLINVNDSASLTLYDLERGVATVTQTEEFFDCLPAARAAFDYAKVFSNKGVDEEEERKKEAEQEESDMDAIKVPARKVERTLEFEEFRVFLQALRQYFIYCQVCFCFF